MQASNNSSLALSLWIQSTSQAQDTSVHTKQKEKEMEKIDSYQCPPPIWFATSIQMMQLE